MQKVVAIHIRGMINAPLVWRLHLAAKNRPSVDANCISCASIGKNQPALALIKKRTLMRRLPKIISFVFSTLVVQAGATQADSGPTTIASFSVAFTGNSSSLELPPEQVTLAEDLRQANSVVVKGDPAALGRALSVHAWLLDIGVSPRNVYINLLDSEGYEDARRRVDIEAHFFPAEQSSSAMSDKFTAQRGEALSAVLSRWTHQERIRLLYQTSFDPVLKGAISEPDLRAAGVALSLLLEHEPVGAVLDFRNPNILVIKNFTKDSK